MERKKKLLNGEDVSFICKPYTEFAHLGRKQRGSYW